ncbi:hypothetical protein QFC22_000830 [Naganishia vaughanmartiniae]|uniref:Uncharacterized protein n=1 Tax=Naganishia vaughanmartiniae TaxID=1424756 RepID=A0ACC2XMV6_9TREE|nr:hypothetical protein QFC22_000830 [Naganishia vaughanmartiniae]
MPLLNAMPAAVAHQNNGGPTAMAKLRAREDDNNNRCVSTVGDNGELAPSGTACGIPEETQPPSMQDKPLPSDVVTITVSSVETSTAIEISTVTALATTTVMAIPSASPLVFQTPEGFTSNENLTLWYGGPKFNDMADVLDKTGNSWQEISAVADVLIQHDNSWLPHAVFGSPVDFYSANPFWGGGKGARARTNLNNEAFIPLNLFPAAEENLLITVTLTGADLTDTGGGGQIRYLWHRAIAKAFDHPHVKDRLLRNPMYNSEMYTKAPEDPRKTMAIFEMLTGYKVELVTKKDNYTTSEVMKNDLASGKGVDGIPTIVYDSDGGMRPIIMNHDSDTNTAQPYRLLDCRVAGTMNLTGIPIGYASSYSRTTNKDAPYAPEGWDRLRSLEEVYNNVTWVLRLTDQKSLDIADTVENFAPLRASFDSYYYQNGTPDEEYVTGSTQRVLVDGVAEPSGSTSAT